MYTKIMSATDGSATAAKAVAIAADLARAVDAELLLVHVGDPDKGRTVLEEAVSKFARGLKTKTMTVSGDPADMIIESAEAEGADLLVVGNKGMTGAKRFLLGSVPNQVSHHSPCNVLIVKTT
ncbi:MAG TPA: universal stress protein [Actinomycetota bacterium]|nr:universal stress protein [Actinomycetota bacterium]